MLFWKVSAVKAFLFSRRSCSVELLLRKKKIFWKNNSCEKVNVLKKGEKGSCSEETTAPKKKLLSRSSYSEKVWRSSFYQNTVVLKKWQHMREGKSLFEKKKPNLTSDYVWLKLFFARGSFTLISIHGNLISILTRVAGTDRRRNH